MKEGQSVPSSQQKSSRDVVLAVVGFVVVVAMLGGLYWRTTYYVPIRTAREAVKERLKSPGSAVFSDEEITPIEGEASVTVRGVVDSQNGFGAMLRATWTVEVHPGGRPWNVQITPQN